MNTLLAVSALGLALAPFFALLTVLGWIADGHAGEFVRALRNRTTR